MGKHYQRLIPLALILTTNAVQLASSLPRPERDERILNGVNGKVKQMLMSQSLVELCESHEQCMEPCNRMQLQSPATAWLAYCYELVCWCHALAIAYWIPKTITTSVWLFHKNDSHFRSMIHRISKRKASIVMFANRVRAFENTGNPIQLTCQCNLSQFSSKFWFICFFKPWTENSSATGERKLTLGKDFSSRISEMTSVGNW